MALMFLFWLVPACAWRQLGANLTVDENSPPDVTLHLNVWTKTSPREAEEILIYPKEVISNVWFRYSELGLLIPCLPRGDFFICEFPEEMVSFPSEPDFLPVSIIFQPLWLDSNLPLILVIEVKADDTLPLHILTAIWQNKVTVSPVLPPLNVSRSTTYTKTAMNETTIPSTNETATHTQLVNDTVSLTVRYSVVPTTAPLHAQLAFQVFPTFTSSRSFVPEPNDVIYMASESEGCGTNTSLASTRADGFILVPQNAGMYELCFMSATLPSPILMIPSPEQLANWNLQFDDISFAVVDPPEMLEFATPPAGPFQPMLPIEFTVAVDVPRVGDEISAVPADQNCSEFALNTQINSSQNFSDPAEWTVVCPSPGNFTLCYRAVDATQWLNLPAILIGVAVPTTSHSSKFAGVSKRLIDKPVSSNLSDISVEKETDVSWWMWLSLGLLSVIGVIVSGFVVAALVYSRRKTQRKQSEEQSRIMLNHIYPQALHRLRAGQVHTSVAIPYLEDENTDSL